LTVSNANPTAGDVSYGHIVEAAEVEQVMPVKSKLVSSAVVKQVVEEYFFDIPIMAQIARCESTYRHYLSDGSVLQGRVDQADTGVMQINKRYHEKTAVAMGLNLDDIEDNMRYARYLYERQGTQPWSASAPCWGNHVAANY